MRAGQLRHRITIERRTDSFDGYGEGQPVWSAIVSNYPARVRDSSQREFTAQLQVQSQKQVFIDIRDPRRPIAEKNRVKWIHPVKGLLILDINEVLGGENAGRDLTLVCSEHSTEQST
jgi:head-tail adaptor